MNTHIPNGWKTLEFERIADLSKEKYNPNKNEHLKCLELEHFEKETGQINGFVNSSLQASTKNKFKQGSILFGKLRPYLRKYTKAKFDGVCSTEIWVLNGKEGICTNDYLYLLVQTNKFNSICNVSSGTHMPRADWGYVSTFPFLCPTLSEQNKIAEVIGCWGEGIEKISNMIALKEHKKKWLMQNLLSGKVRLKGFNKPWKEVRLGDISNLYQPQTISYSSLKDTGYPVYGANGLIGFYDKFNHDCWQITITCRGSTCGTVNKTADKSWITGNAMVVNVDKYNNDKLFLYYTIYNSNFSSIVSGSGQPQIVRTPLVNWKINIPYDISEQSAIAKILSKTDDEINQLKQKLELFKQQKKWLMQQLLTGKKRLKNIN